MQTTSANNISYSIVIPCYRCAAWLHELIDRIIAAMPADAEAYEIILVNDASPDDTWGAIEKEAQRYPLVRGINLLFNVGQFRTTICGLEHARGALIITMDDDLQHPPEELPRLIQTMAENPRLDCVFGAYRERRHNLLRGLGGRLYQKINGALYNKPRDLRWSSFRIMRRQVVEAVCAHRTAKPLINPILMSCTRRLGHVEVEHHPRAGGTSGYRLSRLIQITVDNIVSASTFPLKLVSALGFLSAFSSATLGVFYVARYLAGGIRVAGYASLVLLLLFFGGMILLSIGLLGEYVIRIIAEVAPPPRYMIREDTLTAAPSSAPQAS